jgi:putative transposase
MLSRSAAGSRSIVSMMQEDGEQIGRFKVRGLMRELALVSKQPGSHAYKQATVEKPDIPNILNREFYVPAPNQVWCGDITYIWAQGKWHYLAVVLDVCARRIVGCALSNKPDADVVTKALDMGVPEFETEWIPTMGYMTAQEAHRDISHYLMHRYNWIGPHQFNGGLVPAQAEKKLNAVSGIS